ncbi:helix-turn-helix domain-containing protein [Arthrobacter sp. S2(2024)]|uniref:helix-turn-helix domain-containing protein n=1 Tax=Arthrobacter sp. S2(2024) TaxID=3111911 RepID=UPI002FCB00BB
MTISATEGSRRTYTVTELAEILQLRPATVRANARAGKWPYLQFGPRTMRFTEAHLETILTKSEATPPQPMTRLHRRRGEPPRYSSTAP